MGTNVCIKFLFMWEKSPILLEVSLWSCSWMCVKCDELSVVRGMWGERVRGGGIDGWWWWWWGGGVPDDPSHTQESLETLSAVATHLCLLFLMAGGGGGREGGEMLTLFGCQVSLPPQKSPAIHSVQTVPPAPLGFYFPFPHPFPSLLSSPVWASRWINGPPFFSNLSALLTIELWELFAITTIGCALIFFVLPATHVSIFTNYMFSLSTPMLLAQTVLGWLLPVCKYR